MKQYKMHYQANYQVGKTCAFVLMMVAAMFSSSVLAQQNYFFVNHQANPLKDYSIPSNNESHPFFIDIDGDNDLDCFSGEYTNGQTSKIYLYRNVGNSKTPVFKLINGKNNPLNKAAANKLSIPYFIDIDDDDDYDCFIGEGATGAVVYYKNTGNATHPDFQKQSAAFNPLSMVKFSASGVANPAFADIDGDGDYDCLIADEAGNLNYFKNNGTANKPSFVHIDDDSPLKFLSVQGSIYNVSFVDWNKDGLIDLFINTAYYKNIGTQQIPQFSSGNGDEPVLQNTSAYKYTYTPLRWVDLNNDGTKEVIQGNADGGFTYQTLISSGINKITPVSNILIKVLPNPSKDEFTIHISPAGTSVIRIADVQSRLLITQITNNGSVKIGAGLKPGVYILQITQNNKMIYSQKILKE